MDIKKHVNKHVGKLQNVMGDVKVRTIIILIGALAILAIIIAIVGGKGKNKEEQVRQESSRVAPINEKKVAHTPGAQAVSSEYNEYIREENIRRAEEAERTGRSAIPTITSEELKRQEQRLPTKQEKEQPAVETQVKELYEQRQATKPEQQQREEPKEQPVTQQKSSPANTATTTQYAGIINSQVQTLFSNWSSSSQQTYVVGSNGRTTKPVETSPSAEEMLGPVIYKAGDIVFGVLETSVNSDEPGPVLGKIVQGPLKGSKIIGTLSIPSEWSKKAALQFSVLNVPAMDHSIGLNAVAIDADTARTALATEVDNHYILRYGTLFASSFLSGMSQAVLDAIANPGFDIDENGVIIVDSAKATTRDIILTGLGGIGEAVSENLNFWERPVTIKIASGTGIGLLFLSDLRLENVPPSEGLTPGGGQMTAQPVSSSRPRSESEGAKYIQPSKGASSGTSRPRLGSSGVSRSNMLQNTQ